MYLKIIALAIISLLLDSQCTDTNYRLNTKIKPISYSIAITPYFDTGNNETSFKFDGEVNISFNTEESTKVIKLHSEDLEFTPGNVTVFTSAANIALDGSNPLVFDTNYTFAFINLESELQSGSNYSIRIVYKGKIREELSGFYRNYYFENGVKKWLGATQMQATNARKVFPCFDEPDLKATFTLIINRPESFKPSLANTKMANSVPLSNGYVRETFYPTPKMSTYLVAFLVSEFSAANQSVIDSKEFGIYTRPEAANQTAYVFSFGLKVLNALSSYFQIDYYSTDDNIKMDHVALPDFNAGAMENWGLVKYRESLMLYVPEESSPYYKYRVAQIVAHETTHMWFGDLVTCHWWSDTWLNEGFANYFQDYITATVDPEVSSANMLVTGSVYAAYDADNSPTAVPISNENVNSPAEISNHFGTITYQKAGSVIRMMHHLVGEDAFVKGLHTYLTNNSYSSGYPEKLYKGLDAGVTYYNNTLSSYPGTTISDVMSSWITQAGHPLLTVTINYENGTVNLSQKRFYINSSISSNETYKIPISYTTGSSPDFQNTKPAFIMDTPNYEFTIPNIIQNHSWVLFNVQETGFYRVNYDEHSWQIIINALNTVSREQISNLNRAKIINDLFALFYADEVKFSTLYSALSCLQYESDYSVWYASLRGLNKLLNNYLGSDTYAEIQAATLRFMENAIQYIGYELKDSDDFETLRNRMQLLEFACKLGHQGCIDYSVKLFKGLKDNGTEIQPSLRPVAYCNGLRHGNGEDFDFLWKRMADTNVANEARTIGEILGCTADETRLKSYLVSMLEENSPIRIQDLTMPLTSVLANYAHLHIAIDGLKQNYTLWSSIYPEMETVLTSVAASLHTETEFDDFENWLTSCEECEDQAKVSARTSLAQARAATAWAETHKEDILKSLKSNSPVLMPSFITLTFGLFAILVAF